MTESCLKLGIIGAGIMGRQIAMVSALAGLNVILYSRTATTLEQAGQEIEARLNQGVARAKYSAEIAALAKARIQQTTRLEDAAHGRDFVIESVSESITLKCEIFSQLDRLCPAATILASNTSSLSITELAACTTRPDRVLGLHFFNPVYGMKLIEVVQGLETSESTRAAALALASLIGKEPVVLRDSPGFIASRINVLIGNEAFTMLEQNLASAEDIDKALKLGLNHPMGPFELGDIIGLDVRLAVLQHLQRTLGEKYRPSPLLEQYVKAGRLGRKTGRGVYDYNSKP
jgi:3-hydroxybutyryl-CoA dehydrogenase